MKLKLIALVIPVFFLFVNSNAQYKDLEGVVFGKIMAVGAGGSIQRFKDKQIGTQFSITPITTSILLSSKSIMSLRIGLSKKYTVNFNGNSYGTNYTQTAEMKYLECEGALKIGVTPGGLDKPTSAFLNLHYGVLVGSEKKTDSRYGLSYDDTEHRVYIGGGVSIFQHLGSRFLLFAEPTYRIMTERKDGRMYLGDELEKSINLAHFNCHFGLLFLIGKSE